MDFNYFKFKKQNFKNIFFSLFSAFFSTLFLCSDQTDIVINSFRDFVIKFNNFNVLSLVFFIMLYVFFVLMFNIIDKRTKKYGLTVALILATCFIVGSNMHINSSIIMSPFGFSSVLFFITSLLGLSSILFGFFSFFFFYSNHLVMNQKSLDRNHKIFNGSTKSFFLIMLILILCWIPYFVIFFPGMSNGDSYYQLFQGYGWVPLRDDHPFLHTMLNGKLIKLGEYVLGNINSGISFSTIFEIMLCSSIFSYTITYMANKKVSTKLCLFTLLFYSLHPVIAIYSMSLWKDIYMAVFLLLYSIILYEINLNPNEFFSKKKNLSFFCLVLFLILISKGTGILFLIMTFPFVLISTKKHWKSIILVFSASIFIFLSITLPLKSILNVGPIQAYDIFSVPVQQIARSSMNNKESLTEEEKEFISEFFSNQDISALYDSRLSDNVKQTLDLEKLSTNKVLFFKQWLKLGLKHPKSYIESFLANSYGYWYPFNERWVINLDSYIVLAQNDYKILGKSPSDPNIANYRIPSWQLKSRNIINYEFNNKNGIMRSFPLLSWIPNIGFYFWIAFITFIYCLYHRKKELLLPFSLALAIFITCITSPVYAELRYGYSIMLMTPLIISMSLQKKLTNTKK